MTAGGVVFMAGTEDGYFRAFDAKDGRLLFEYELPFFAPTVPMTYSIDGKQYVAVAAGGHTRMHVPFDSRAAAPVGDALVVFALPE